MLEDDHRQDVRAESRQEQRIDRGAQEVGEARLDREAVAAQEHLGGAEVGDGVGVEVVAVAAVEVDEGRERRGGDDEREGETAAHGARFYPRSNESNSSGRAERTRASSTVINPCRTRRTSESSSEIIPRRLPRVISETRLVSLSLRM